MPSTRSLALPHDRRASINTCGGGVLLTGAGRRRNGPLSIFRARRNLPPSSSPKAKVDTRRLTFDDFVVHLLSGHTNAPTSSAARAAEERLLQYVVEDPGDPMDFLLEPLLLDLASPCGCQAGPCI